MRASPLSPAALAALGAFSFFTSGALAQSDSTSANDSPCPPIRIYTLEDPTTADSGALAVATTLLDVLPGVNITRRMIPPPQSALPSRYELGFATINGAVSLSLELQRFGAACPAARIVLLGEAAGAAVLSATLGGTDILSAQFGALGTLRGLEDEEAVASQVIAAVTWQDPFQAGQGVQAACPACTSGGPFARTGQYYTWYQTFADRVQSFCLAGDAYCCDNHDNSTTVLPASAYFTRDTHAYAVSFVANKFPNNAASAFGSQYFPSLCSVSSSVAAASTTPAQQPQTTPVVQTTTVLSPTAGASHPAVSHPGVSHPAGTGHASSSPSSPSHAVLTSSSSQSSGGAAATATPQVSKGEGSSLFASSGIVGGIPGLVGLAVAGLVL